MAKKTRKVRQMQSNQRAMQQALSNVQSVSVAPAATAVAPSAQAQTRVMGGKPQLDPAEEYKYVRGDLKRIAVLAVSFTAIMVVLSFVLPTLIK